MQARTCALFSLENLRTGAAKGLKAQTIDSSSKDMLPDLLNVQKNHPWELRKRTFTRTLILSGYHSAS